MVRQTLISFETQKQILARHTLLSVPCTTPQQRQNNSGAIMRPGRQHSSAPAGLASSPCRATARCPTGGCTCSAHNSHCIIITKLLVGRELQCAVPRFWVAFSRITRIISLKEPVICARIASNSLLSNKVINLRKSVGRWCEFPV